MGQKKLKWILTRLMIQHLWETMGDREPSADFKIKSDIGRFDEGLYHVVEGLFSSP